MLRNVAEQVDARYVSLDVTSDLRAARVDPAGFVQRDQRPLFIDEVQRGGDPLVLAIKAAVDLSDERGQFALAGSTRFLTEPRLSESLAGRARFVDLWPLSQGEIDGLTNGDRFVDACIDGFDGLAALGQVALPAERRDVFARVLRGGFPEAVLAASDRDRADFLADYVRTISQRDIAELGRITDRVDLPKVLRLLAARSASELNVSDLANDAGLGPDTTRRYLPLVDAIFLLHRLPVWSRSATSRTKRRPKIHLTDTGLAAWLARIRPDALDRPGHPLDGALLESFVVNELMRQAGWSREPVSLAHWRDRNGREVDVIVETGDRNIVGIEVKAAVEVTEGDVPHLAYLRDAVGPDFVAGVVLHLGTRLRRFGDRLLAMPITALWS